MKDIRTAHEEEFGELEYYCKESESKIQDDDGLTCALKGDRIRIIIPRMIGGQVLDYLYGSRPNGHIGVEKKL